MKSLRKLINHGIRKTGWALKKIEVRKPQEKQVSKKSRIVQNSPVPPKNPAPARPVRATMNGALEWLGGSGIPIKTVLDVGASNGCWSSQCMRYIAATDYVLFEPQPVHEPELDAFKSKSAKNVTLIKKAVGSTDGMTYFQAEDPFGGALSSVAGQHMIQVPMTTIDRSVQEHSLKGPFLLKLDTHGFEPSILAGAVGALEQCSVLIIEAYNFQITGEAVLFWELCAMLARKGFRCVDMVDLLHRKVDSTLWQMDIVFIRDNWDGFKNLAYA